MRSLAIITRLCSQRSTNVPAIGPRKMLGRVAARKTRPGGEGRVGDAVTSTPSATWFRRSPKRLIVWASQYAENRESSASRT